MHWINIYLTGVHLTRWSKENLVLFFLSLLLNVFTVFSLFSSSLEWKIELILNSLLVSGWCETANTQRDTYTSIIIFPSLNSSTETTWKKTKNKVTNSRQSLWKYISTRRERRIFLTFPTDPKDETKTKPKLKTTVYERLCFSLLGLGTLLSERLTDADAAEGGCERRGGRDRSAPRPESQPGGVALVLVADGRS